MKLYVNGDSHSAGHDAGGIEYSYGYHLANRLNADFQCSAISGCSNETILRTSNEYLKNNRPDLVIIGWSTWDREEWMYNDQPIYVTSSGYDSVPVPLQTTYKKWVIEYADTEKQKQKELYWHERIKTFHLELLERNIPHLFFNCFSFFWYTDIYKLPKYDWGNYYINPYSKDFTYYYWLEDKGFKPSNPKFYHYGPDAHVAWAEFLVPYVENLLT